MINNKGEIIIKKKTFSDTHHKRTVKTISIIMRHWDSSSWGNDEKMKL
jgi:hypothetical protein